MTTDVLFGQGCFLRLRPQLWALRQPYPPLGTLYAAASVRERGYQVRVFDAMLAKSEAEWAEALDRDLPRVAVLYDDNVNHLSRMSLPGIRRAGFVMIDAARARGIPVVVAGSDAAGHPALYLERGAGVVVTGGAEVTLIEVLDAMNGCGDRPLSKVAGVCLLDTEGRIVRTASRGFLCRPDRLPRPAWDLVDVAHYRSIWRRRHGYFSMNLATAHDDPSHGGWPAKPIHNQRHAPRTPEQVVDEMAWLEATYQPDHLSMVDDGFGLTPGWIERFAAAIAARDSRVPYTCRLRADAVNATVAAALSASGCRTAWIGAESGSQRILDAMERGIHVGQIAEATRQLRAAGIEVGFLLQFGHPGETLVDIQRTLQMLQTCAPDEIGVSLSCSLPPTVYARVKARFGRQRSGDADDLAVMCRSTYSPEFYRTLVRLVHAEFRVQRAGRLLRMLARRPGTCRVPMVRELAAGLFQLLCLPWIRRRVDWLAGNVPADAPPALLPVLSGQAGAAPSEPSR